MKQRQIESSILLSMIDPVFILRLAGYESVAWQQELASHPSKRKIALCSRQVGKSLTAAAIALQTMLRYENRPVIIITPTERQGQQLLRYVKDLISVVPFVPKIVHETQKSIEFMTKSRILVLPGKSTTIRSFSNAKLIIMDEAAFIADDVYSAIEPMVAKDGTILFLSTPYGKQGFFHKTWNDPSTNWHKIRVTAYDCPYRYTKEELDQKKTDPLLGKHGFAREYMCEFTDTIDQVFDAEAVQRAFSADIKPLF